MVGRIVYYLLWPILWATIPLSRRVRVAVVYDGKVLLVQNWIGAGNWELPGGGIKFGESAEDAAVREIREELHLHLENIEKLTSLPITVKKNGLIQHLEYFQATISPDEEIIQNWEIAKVSWLPVGDLEKERVLPDDVRLQLSSSELMQDDTL